MPISRDALRLSEEELDALLSSAHELHVATVSPDGSPHVVPLWFVWLDGSVYVNNLRASRRSRDLAAGSRVAVCVDAGITYPELRGAVLKGRFVEATDDPVLPKVRAAFAEKYWGGASVPELRSHVWLRLQREHLATWDFRKIPAGRDKRLEADRKG